MHHNYNPQCLHSTQGFAWIAWCALLWVVTYW